MRADAEQAERYAAQAIAADPDDRMLDGFRWASRGAVALLGGDFEADQGRNHLKVIFDAVLNFPEQRVLLADSLLQRFSFRFPMRGYVDERDKPKQWHAIVVLDEVRISISERRFLPWLSIRNTPT